jgi:hypothetical protein
MLTPLTELPEWYAFRELYQTDIYAFATNVLNMDVTWQQEELFDTIRFGGSRTTVASGHGTGKTRSMAVVALWHLLCFENSVTMFTAPQIQQLRNQTWKEIALCFTQMKNGAYSWLCDYVKILTEKVFIVGRGIEWHVLAKTAPKNAATNIAGQHGDNLLIWADEASGVENAVMETLMGALTHKDNRMVLTSQPTKGSGFFYDTHHSLSYIAGGVWVNIIMNSELSPIVSISWLSEQLKKYGSVDDPMYQIRVLGIFPDLTGEFIVPRRLVDAMYVGKHCIGKKREFGYIMCVDVGGGVGRDDSVIAIGKVSGDAHYGDDARRVDIVDIPLIDNTSEIDRLLNCIDEQMAKYPNISLVIDANGAGRGLAQALKARGIYFVEVHWGGVCFDQEAKETFHNKRSQAIVCMARAVGGGRLKIHTEVGKTKLQDQVSRIPYSFDDNSRWYVLPKESMRRRGLKSPDIADVLAFFFLDGVMYTPANESVYNKKEDEITASTSELEALAAQMLA